MAAGGDAAEDRMVRRHRQRGAARPPASSRRAKRKASVALPMPAGPVISQA